MTRTKCKVEDLNLGTNRKELRKWKEIKLETEKKFNFIVVIEYGTVKSSNEKKRQRILKEKSLEKERKRLQELKRKENIADIAEKKRNNFFKCQEVMKKRKRDEEDNQSEKKIHVEDNPKRKEMPSNQGNHHHHHQSLTLSLSLERKQVDKKSKGGKENSVSNLLKLFENIESKEDRLRDHQGGPQVCLAHIANQRKAKMEVTNRALIGGDSGPVGPRANENEC